MTTPNNKSWEEDYSSLFTFEQGFVCPVCRVVRPTNGGIKMKCPTVTEGVECGGTMMTNLMYARDYGKQFISSLLQQERKAERERVLGECRKRVIDECIQKCNFFISRNLEMNPYDTAWNDAANAIVERLELLKEEL